MQVPFKSYFTKWKYPWTRPASDAGAEQQFTPSIEFGRPETPDDNDENEEVAWRLAENG